MSIGNLSEHAVPDQGTESRFLDPPSGHTKAISSPSRGRKLSRKPATISIEGILSDVNKLEEYFRRQKNETAILFADLVGSTDYKQRRGPLSGVLKVWRHNELVRETATRQRLNGQVVKYIGDGVLVRFDHKNPLEAGKRALRCAIEVQQKLREFNSTITDPKERIESRIGVTLGAVIDFYGNDPIGPIVDLAARVQAHAKPGQILAHSSIIDRVNSKSLTCEIGDRSLVSLRGVPGLQEVSEILYDGERRGIQRDEEQYPEQWTDYVYEATFLPLDQSKYGPIIADEYFGILLDLRYKAVLRLTILPFVCVDNIIQFNEALGDSVVFATFMLPHRKEFDEIPSEIFDIEFCEINGISMVKEKSDDIIPGTYRRLDMTSDCLSALLGKEVEIRYRMVSLVRKRGHFFCMVTQYPTKRISMKIDMAQVDIDQIKVVDYFASKVRSKFMFTPRERPKKIEVSIDDWIYPRGGAVFVWSLPS